MVSESHIKRGGIVPPALLTDNYETGQALSFGGSAGPGLLNRVQKARGGLFLAMVFMTSWS